MRWGPKVGDPSPIMTLSAIAGGDEIHVGSALGRSQLLFFPLADLSGVQRNCCRSSKVDSHRREDWLGIVLASDGELPEHLAFYRSAEGWSSFPYVLSNQLAITFHVGKAALRGDRRGGTRADPRG